MNTRACDLVIFDCDGVLVDSERISARVFSEILAELGLVFTLPEMIETFMGSSMQRCVDIVTERLGCAPPADLLDRYHVRMRDVVARELTAVEGIVSLLDILDREGLPYAVASNGEHAKMESTLGVTGLRARTEGRRFSATDVAHPKPAPDLFLHAAQNMGVVPSRCLVVEDSPFGVAGAAAAGMIVIGYADLMPGSRLTAAGATHIVSSLADVPALLGIA